ncbi:hypothetical protein L1D94_20000 [Vibrio alginolyticus]|uniref:hypothetical protein n=1 Tax=Vibrio alginolyticus TaxID=663 RepID=UPI001EFC3585|nr:hypothetical protein [Vibrio alginolyticus]MCG9718904.1 hypothetical protein [Vibrio alginolyticus]
MKDIVKSLKDNATSRLKNPVIGAFVLSWTVLNINGVLLFLLVDSDTKIEIVKGKSWSTIDDFILPLAVSIAYLLFLPLLNMAYEFINDGFINFYRKQRQNITAKKLAIQKKETVIAEIESDVAYLQKLKDKDIDGWLEQKKARNNEFISLKKRYSKLVSESSEDKRKSLAELSEVRRELYTLQSEQANIEKEQQKKRSIVEQSTDQLENLLKSIENRGSESQLSSTDIKNIRKQVESIRLEFFIWDEEIPF